MESKANSQIGDWKAPIAASSEDLENSLKSFLQEETPVLSQNGVNLERIEEVESPHGIHYSYRQTWFGYPIYGSNVKLNLTSDLVPKSLFNKTADTRYWPGKGELFDSQIISYEDRSLEKTEKVVFIQNGEPVAALAGHYINREENIYEERVYGLESGEKLHQRDLKAYKGKREDLIEVEGKVFYPNPISSADTTYGGPFRDFDGRDTAALNNERRQVSFHVAEDDSDTLMLRGPNLKIEDFSPPHNEPAQSLDSSFNYTRSEPQFKEVNAYYHIHTFREYVNELGYEGISDNPVSVDARAGHADQSFFVAEDNEISLGVGGVPDGEDADVVLHEYGHALSYYASPGSFNGHESRSFEEGFCDYFACSYGRSLQPERWKDLFNWDGHNEFWSGRWCVTDQRYPEDLSDFDIYSNGEMWAGTLMEIEEEIGRDTTMFLMMSTLYDLAPSMAMEDGAKAFLQNDSLILDGRNSEEIARNLAETGFIDHFNPLEEKLGSYNCSESVLSGFRKIESNTPVLEVTSDKPLNGRLKIFDLQGRERGASSIDGTEARIVLENRMSSGVYILHFHLNQCTVQEKVFIE